MSHALKRSHVLIIEDDRKLTTALISGIEAEGYRVTAASSAEEGFFLLHSDRPDLLLLDVTLPQRNGLDLLRQIRPRSDRYPHSHAHVSQFRSGSRRRPQIGSR